MTNLIKLFFTAFIVCLGTIGLPQTAHAKSDEIYTSWRNNLAVGGYDVVSFHQGNPIEGKPKLAAAWHGANWLFASQDNLDAFIANPEKYAPAYGGYCAWAVAKNKLAKGKPKHWTIKDGVLYLNFNKKIKDRWLKDIDGFIAKGNANWPAILED
ncbi:MAG: twin-arginine translocation pathway signal protein [Robiginitomaculum sp.]|nr:twin-arginine translocation pathway signal protein [Robiginitomaculum sp.]